jgi:hypothetical protein
VDLIAKLATAEYAFFAETLKSRREEKRGSARSGHESIETTHIYFEADLAMKERALASIAPDSTPLRRFRADDTLLAFLQSL